MSKRMRIALLVGQAEEAYQEQFISGFLEHTFENDWDVCVFAMYQRSQESAARGIGESSIFALIQFDHFDAVVLMLDTLQTPGLADAIEERVKKSFSGSVLCIDAESKYFPYIEMNYYKSVKTIVAHLIEHHGLTDIAYLTGHKEHKHSVQRLQAYLDCMEEHGLPVADNRIFYGDYWYDGGEQMAKELLKERDKLPQAIACANDYMAIGVTKELIKAGVQVPEEVAVVGYESVEAGKDSPKPITSTVFPTKQYGRYAAACIKALSEGRELPEFEEEIGLFIGSSCGCHNDSIVPKVLLRQKWDTDTSERDLYSLNNHMNEDLLCQNTFYDLMKVLEYYIYPIRDFDGFHICLNEDWNDFEKKAKEGRQDEIFSRRMLHVLKCNSKDSSGDVISFDTFFHTTLLLPELHEKHAKPSVYFFTPLYFEEKNFGYTVLCYEDRAKSYSATYRMWLRNVMQAFECFRRIETIQRSNQMLEASMVRDVLTGLYNYNGFLKQRDHLVRKAMRTGNSKVGALAVDIKELMKINELHGRAEGDRVILTVAHTLRDIFPDAVNVCFGSGEMVAVLVSQGNVEEILCQGFEKLRQQLAEYNQATGKDYSVEMYSGIEVGSPQNEEELERLVNVAVSKKNGSKINEPKMLQGATLTEEEYKEARIVQELLDENRFAYHFQPIVNAKTGEIFGYEALMRPDVEPYMPPPVVLKYAEYYGRLYDVEKATFFNVLNMVSLNRAVFDGNVKIFINSIPGKLLHGDDALKLEMYARELPDTVVVELTEQQELNEEELSVLREYYRKIGFQTAIDDYGTGYSNVTNLLRYMPNCVKIDRMLLSNIQDSPQKQHFVKDIITFAHDNDILVLAEGVETSEELQMVIHLGVDLIQGYYTARPAKEMVPSIARNIKSEIVEINKTENHNRGRRVYVAGKERRVSLARLVAEKYSIIEITNEETVYRDVTIAGVPELETDMYLRVKNGYRGRILLDNVTLQGKKHGACIDIGNDCEVVIVLQGDNYCVDGGIRVPFGSTLTFEGDGHLHITVDAANYFGIGNSIDMKHGELIFAQDGIIEVRGSGMKGIGIGSGLGGSVKIQKGKYILWLNGQEGVGIGSYSGDIAPVIRECDVQVHLATGKAVGIGSVTGKVTLSMESLTWTGEFNADDIVGLGTLDGEDCSVEISHANIMMDIRAFLASGIGAHAGEVAVHLDNCAVHITGDGSNVVAVGNQTRTAQIRIDAAKLESSLKTSLNSDMGAEYQNILMTSGECIYTLNGKQIIKHAE